MAADALTNATTQKATKVFICMMINSLPHKKKDFNHLHRNDPAMIRWISGIKDRD